MDDYFQQQLFINFLCEAHSNGHKINIINTNSIIWMVLTIIISSMTKGNEWIL